MCYSNENKVPRAEDVKKIQAILTNDRAALKKGGEEQDRKMAG